MRCRYPCQEVQNGMGYLSEMLLTVGDFGVMPRMVSQPTKAWSFIGRGGCPYHTSTTATSQAMTAVTIGRTLQAPVRGGAGALVAGGTVHTIHQHPLHQACDCESYIVGTRAWRRRRAWTSSGTTAAWCVGSPGSTSSPAPTWAASPPTSARQVERLLSACRHPTCNTWIWGLVRTACISLAWCHEGGQQILPPEEYVACWWALSAVMPSAEQVSTFGRRPADLDQIWAAGKIAGTVDNIDASWLRAL